MIAYNVHKLIRRIFQFHGVDLPEQGWQPMTQPKPGFYVSFVSIVKIQWVLLYNK